MRSHLLCICLECCYCHIMFISSNLNLWHLSPKLHRIHLPSQNTNQQGKGYNNFHINSCFNPILSYPIWTLVDDPSTHNGQQHTLCDIYVRGAAEHIYGAQSVLEFIMGRRGVHYCYYIALLTIPVLKQINKTPKRKPAMPSLSIATQDRHNRHTALICSWLNSFLANMSIYVYDI